MGNSNQPKPSPNSISTVPWEAVHAVADSVGRRGVRIYGLSIEQLWAVVFTIIFVGIPLFAFLAMIPVWDYIGELVVFAREFIHCSSNQFA